MWSGGSTDATVSLRQYVTFLEPTQIGRVAFVDEFVGGRAAA